MRFRLHYWEDYKAVENADKIARAQLGEATNVAFMDKMVGVLLDELEAAGELENTVGVFISDHSMFLGNQSRFHKGTLFHDVLSSSLIVRYPERFDENEIIDHAVERLDLNPPAFELAGGVNPDRVAKSGFTFFPLLEGRSSKARYYACSEIL